MDAPVVEILNPDPVVILETSPQDGQILWESLEAIIVTFSSPMNTTSVQWDIWPETTDFILSWSQNDTVLTLDPVQYLHWGQTYVVSVNCAEDKEGNILAPGLVPNPWSFYLDMCPVHITSTSPSDGATDVALDASIWVLFSVCMDPHSLNWSIEPFIELTPVWDDYYIDLRFIHESPFEDCTQYTIEVDAIDYGGRGLDPGPVPNPWSFTTLCTPAQLMTDISSDEAVPLPDNPFNTDFGEPLIEIGPPSEDGEGTEDIDNARDETYEHEMAEGAVLEVYSGPDFRDSSGQGFTGV
ncbi:MAG: Ig-like domain-containing protein, partial [Candidatus Thermoplasmatota archaeon]|nr:Ig-like domain-containing protein [Candidatus Thermoplasmatota archaeon]